MSNVPDDWGSYYRRCAECRSTYHLSEGGCGCEDRDWSDRSEDLTDSVREFLPPEDADVGADSGGIDISLWVSVPIDWDDDQSRDHAVGFAEELAELIKSYNGTAHKPLGNPNA